MSLSRTVLSGILVSALLSFPTLAQAQTPLLDQYNSYFATPFESSLHPVVLSLPAGEPLPLGFVMGLIDPIYVKRERDRARINRVIDRFGSATGFEDANGDGVVSQPDLAALDAHVFQRIRQLGWGYSDDELEIPRAFDWSDLPDREQYERVLELSAALERSCIEIGCDQDEDGVDDLEDSCPEDSNPLQADADNDGYGDVCDFDDDNNGVADAVDDCLVVATDPSVCLRGVAVVAEAVTTVRETLVNAELPVPGELDGVLSSLDETADLLLAGDPNSAATLLFSVAQQSGTIAGEGIDPALIAWIVALAESLAAGL